MKTLIALCALLLTIMLIPDVESQCNYAGPPVTSTFPPNYNVVVKTLTGHNYCRAQRSLGAEACWPSETGLVRVSMLTAIADPSVHPSPFCEWQCLGCGKIYRIDGSDGLPVELMEFSVE